MSIPGGMTRHPVPARPALPDSVTSAVERAERSRIEALRAATATAPAGEAIADTLLRAEQFRAFVEGSGAASTPGSRMDGVIKLTTGLLLDLRDPNQPRLWSWPDPNWTGRDGIGPRRSAPSWMAISPAQADLLSTLARGSE